MKSYGRIHPLWVLLLFTLVLVLLNRLNQYLLLDDSRHQPGFPVAIKEQGVLGSDLLLAQAFHDHQSHISLSGEGRIIRLLSDDLNGSRHQRFVVKLESGQTLLIVHNIDLSQPITALAVGASVEFAGEYIWNAQGGLIHWTHVDPTGRQAGGWIKYRGQVYR